MPKPALPTLIKLAVREVEAAQQALADNHAAQNTERTTITHWQQEAAAAFASAVAEESVQEMQAAGLFQGRAQSEIARAEDRLANLKQAEQALRSTLQTAYAKQQRYEILQTQQQQAAKRTAARKAQAALDDLRRKH
jgi:flagellar export protein FliJ